MQDYLDFRGASGKTYRYGISVGQMSPMGGNYALVREVADGGWALIYLGEAESLSAEAHARRTKAEAQDGPLHLYIRLNISKSVRRAEKDDIVAGAAPPLNTAEGDFGAPPERPEPRDDAQADPPRPEAR